MRTIKYILFLSSVILVGCNNVSETTISNPEQKGSNTQDLSLSSTSTNIPTETLIPEPSITPTIAPTLTPTTEPIQSNNLDELKELFRYQINENDRRYIYQDPEGNSKIIVASDKEVSILNLESLDQELTFSLPYEPSKKSALSQDGLLLANVNDDNFIEIYDLANEQIIALSSFNIDGDISIYWSYKSDYLLVYNHSKWEIGLHHINEDEYTHLHTCSYSHCNLIWSENGNYLAIGDYMKDTSFIFSLSPIDNLCIIKGNVYQWSHNEDLSAGIIDDANGPLGAIWSQPNGERLHTLYGLNRGPFAAGFSFDNMFFAASDMPGIDLFIVWDVSDGSIINRFNGHPGGINSVKWFHNENILFTLGEDNQIKFWNPNNPETLYTLQVPDIWNAHILQNDRYFVVFTQSEIIIYGL